MTRTINILLILLMALSAAAVYDMKYEAELAAENVAQLERRIAQQQEQLSLLKAEWSVLTQPSRLQALVERHQSVLQLETLRAEHIGTLADVPEKPVEIPDADAPSDEAVPPGPTQREAAAPGAADPAAADLPTIR